MVDTDGDDFGDNPFGDIRDDCPDEAGQSTIDRQGCPDSNADGYSDEYGYWEGIKASMGDDPFGNWLSWSIWVLVLLATYLTAVIRKKRGDVE